MRGLIPPPPLRRGKYLQRLTKNPARLSTERGLCKGPDTQPGLSGSDMRLVKQRCQRSSWMVSELLILTEGL
jgi:hypothetical protein